MPLQLVEMLMGFGFNVDACLGTLNYFCCLFNQALCEFMS